MKLFTLVLSLTLYGSASAMADAIRLLSSLEQRNSVDRFFTDVNFSLSTLRNALRDVINQHEFIGALHTAALSRYPDKFFPEFVQWYNPALFRCRPIISRSRT